MKIPQHKNPFGLFRLWHDEARATGEPMDADVMTLATIDQSGLPSARVVLLNGLDERGFVFYTNLGSAKAQQMDKHPKAP